MRESKSALKYLPDKEVERSVLFAQSKTGVERVVSFVFFCLLFAEENGVAQMQVHTYNWKGLIHIYTFLLVRADAVLLLVGYTMHQQKNL